MADGKMVKTALFPFDPFYWHWGTKKAPGGLVWGIGVLGQGFIKIVCQNRTWSVVGRVGVKG